MVRTSCREQCLDLSLEIFFHSNRHAAGPGPHGFLSNQKISKRFEVLQETVKSRRIMTDFKKPFPRNVSAVSPPLRDCSPNLFFPRVKFTQRTGTRFVEGFGFGDTQSPIRPTAFLARWEIGGPMFFDGANNSFFQRAAKQYWI